MAELSAVPFSALPQASDGYTVLYENDQVCRSEKKLSELVGNKTSSFLTKEQGDSLYQEKGDYLVDDDITGKLDKEQYANDSATFLTAHQDISNKLDTTAFSTVSGNFLTAHQNLDEYATLEWVNNQGFLKEHQPISANEWNDVYETVVTNSGTWSTETDWTDDINAASAYAYEKAVEQIPTDYYPNTNPSGFISGVDLSNYYEKSATSGKTELSNKFETKQDLIENKKDSSIPYLETANSNPSWETIETYKINAHGTAVEGELYDIPINGRTYKVVCLNGKLWLAENYVDEQNATYTDEEYGSYFTKSQMDNCVPEGWRLPTDADFQELITNEPDHCEKYFSTNWHTDETSPNYVTCTNELKLNLQPGGEYNSYGGTVNSKTYLAYYGTSTKELKSQSTQLQRVYYKLENYVDSTTKMFTKCWGNYNDGDYSYKVNVRLIKDDLEVPAPDGWKKFNGKNFMAIADDEGNTFKDFYLKTSAAQQLYQPKGDYASSAGATVLNTYYGLTTTGWKDISTNYYDKQTIDNMIAGAGGDYVPLSATDCRIGSENTSISVSFAQGENNSAGYIIVYPEATIEDEFIPEHSEVLGYSFAQGKDNLSYSSSLAQGVSNSATHVSFAQGFKNYSNSLSVCFGFNNSAEGFSFSLGNSNTAYENSFAQGLTTTAAWYSVAMGNSLSANAYSVAVGSGLTASIYSFNFGVNNFAEKYSQTFGYGLRATNYATAYGYDGDVVTLGSFVIGEFNKTSAAPFVIGNGTFEGNRSDLFVVDKDGNVSAQGQIYAGGGVLGAALDTLELAPDNETIEFVTSSHNVVNGGSSAEEYTVIKIKTSLLNKINELYNLVSSNSGNSNWTSPQ